MPSNSWKKFEARSAALFGLKRAWANSGERFDFPSGDRENAPVVGQCKEVKSLSLNALVKLTEEMAAETKGKPQLGVVCAKVRRGSGTTSAPIVAMTFETFYKLVVYPTILTRIQESCIALEKEKGN